MKWITAALVLAALVLVQADAKAFEQTYTVVIDDYEQSNDFNRTGGNRGTINDYDYGGAVSFDQRDSCMTATFEKNGPGWGGMFYNILRDGGVKQPLNFNRIFGKYVSDDYQGKVIGIDVVIKSVSSPSNNNNLKLMVEVKKPGSKTAKKPSPWHLKKLTTLTYPYTFHIDLSKANIGDIGTVTWLIDTAKNGDSISVDSIKLRVNVKSPGTLAMPLQDQAFLWSYANLMANYDKASGMVQDRSNYKNKVMENVSATGKAAKLTAYAYKKELISEAYAKRIICKIATRLTNRSFPKGPEGINTLWPHFTINGGKKPHPDSEWSSADTVYAAMDVIAALQMIEDPHKQIPRLESFLKAINWQALILSTGHISHGYSNTGALLPYGWDTFGMEAIGINWTYASVTGNLTDMDHPPSYNGSGFIDNMQSPMCLSGKDGWLNDWDAYRNNMANTQIAWYTAAKNTYINAAGLFGLSAAEVPEGNDYKAYGVGGIIPAEDGNAEVIVPHYAGMIADIKLADSSRVWNKLLEWEDISPLTNVESMRISKVDGTKTVNYLKGSWNLALQAEGWAMADSTCKDALKAAILGNEFLKSGYQKIKGNQPLKALKKK